MSAAPVNRDYAVRAGAMIQELFDGLHNHAQEFGAVRCHPARAHYNAKSNAWVRANPERRRATERRARMKKSSASPIPPIDDAAKSCGSKCGQADA